MRLFKTLSKRGLALFLAFTMCVSMIQTSAFAAANEPGSEPSGTTVNFTEHNADVDGYDYTTDLDDLGYIVGNSAQNSVIDITNNYEKSDLAVTGVMKERLTSIPAGIDVSDINTDATVVLPADGSSVTLLYAITVTGDAGAEYTVTDAGADVVSGSLTGTIPEAGSVVIYVTKSFDKDDLVNGKLVNTASVNEIPEDDDDTVETLGEIETEVIAPNLSVVKTADKAKAAVGETITYTITVTNNGTAEANNVAVSDNLDSEYLNLVRATLDGETVEDYRGSVTVPTLAASGKTELVIVARTLKCEVDPAAPYCVTAAVSGEPPPEPDLHVSAYPAPHAITVTVLEQE